MLFLIGCCRLFWVELLGCCYQAARVFWWIARVFWVLAASLHGCCNVVSKVFGAVAKVLLGYC